MAIHRQQTSVTRIFCDLCPRAHSWPQYLTKAHTERLARDLGWRKDKLGRHICPTHPKLKGARS